VVRGDSDRLNRQEEQQSQPTVIQVNRRRVVAAVAAVVVLLYNAKPALKRLIQILVLKALNSGN
jgi:hypothetical protein